MVAIFSRVCLFQQQIQGNSEIWQIWREDGCSFGDGNYLDVNYHSFDPFRLLRGSAAIPEIELGKGEASINA